MPMASPEIDLQKAHELFAVSCFNDAWNLIDKPSRTADEDEEMLRLAMTSAWHWTQREDCSPQNLSIAYWQISRVHAILGRGAEALRYGQLCLGVSQSKGIAPFALAYAHEALARAELVLGNRSGMQSQIGAAKKVAEAISDEETKRMLLGDLATIT